MLLTFRKTTFMLILRGRNYCRNFSDRIYVDTSNHNSQVNALMLSQVYQNNRNIQRGVISQAHQQQNHHQQPLRQQSNQITLQRSHALNIQPGQVRQQFHPQTNAYYDDMLNQFVNGHIVIYPQETYFETVQDENNTLSILENAYR
ncbi:10929_t:CDS:2 [Ambispora leptoticha]|uniref:10929_t:CDS:1 n=1 Tax=Ambispora leptoticha TaxID=144679 RepID=A0A9N9E0I4_9GLOM|nr:10929_t:CDS:2 [Ambispora leptoticha]